MRETGPEMVDIPAGNFPMGTGDDQVERLCHQFELARRWKEKGYFEREKPQHSVWLPDFSIGRHPVTVGEYRLFVEASGYSRQRYWSEDGWQWLQASNRRQPDYWSDNPWTEDERLPVVGVSFYEATAYCSWLGHMLADDFRLPSEAEWEKAARGTDGRLYPWGDDFESTACNMRDSGPGQTTTVGYFSPAGVSPYGCSDMAGNVSEWTASPYRAYPFDAGAPPHAHESESLFVLRGGSWHSNALRVRASARGINDPWFTDNDVGFRLAA